MQTAVAAGMYPVGVLWGFRPEAELRANGAARVVESPDEIITMLGIPS
jgi:phosphoglycolate phosphatase